MIPDERRRRLLHFVEERGSASVADLTEHLGVSHMTVRRDIRVLEESGRLISVSGGVAMPSRIALDATRQAKLVQHTGEKEVIAARAADLISEGDLVYLDAGTTMLAVARVLLQRFGEAQLDVVTNDLMVASALGEHQQARVHVLGGQLDSPNMSTHGTITAEELQQFNIDVAFVSASSFDLRGLSVPTDAKSVVKRAIIESSSRAFLATDSSKYGKVAAFKALPLASFDGLVTDSGLPAAAQERVQSLGVELLISDSAGRDERNNP